ncbi:MAG: RNA-guided pseudouridylation complex pseudouridine synthase subunit Cbf5 [Candidatus Aenigmarchaeota archaeon]|nr:RNA-guided pseudouridylation complex pseudouridine synthase subunit Cbf5 [Candidatus Aenigmarchaeota archaeon]
MREIPIRELIYYSLININKPSGPLSRDVDDRIRKLFKVDKVGHAGTLDPKVSGVLVVALGEATKILKFLMKSDKEYEGIMYLHNDVSKDVIEKTIKTHFLGEITQIPPVHSQVARKERKRTIYSFEIIGKQGKDVTFRTKVESGTYIRKLIHDLGEELGTGAHMKYLKRTKTGKFKLEDSYEIEDIEKAYESWKKGDEESLRGMLIPMEKAIELKRIVIKDQSLPRIRNGSPVKRNDIVDKDDLNPGETIGIFSKNGRIIALGIVRNRSRIKTDRVFIVKK